MISFVGLKLSIGLLVMVSCISTPGRQCADGLVCPEDMACSETLERCVSEAEQRACDFTDNGLTCIVSSSPGVCVDGVCDSTCGNGVVDELEQCDLDSQACVELGFDMGAATCTETCAQVREACVGFGFDTDALEPPFAFYDDAWSSSDGSGVRVVSGKVSLSPATGVLGTYRGGSWDVRNLANTRLHAVWGRSGTEVYAVGTSLDADGDPESPVIYRFDGSEWSLDSLDTYEVATVGLRILEVWGIENLLFLGTSAGVLLWSDGKWRADSEDIGRVTAIGGSSTEVYAQSSALGLVRRDASAPLGTRWEVVSPNPFAGDFMTAATSLGNDVFLVSNRGRAVVGSVTSGWRELVWRIGQPFNAVEASANRVIAVGQGGRVVQLYPGSHTLVTDTVRPFIGVSVDGDGFEAWSQSGELFRWQGQGWTVPRFDNNGVFGADENIQEVWTDGLETVAVGSESFFLGMVKHRSGGGWEPLGSGLDRTYRFHDIWGRAAGDLYIIGSNGPILQPTGGVALHWDGSNWSEVLRAPAGESYRDIAGDDEGVFVSGTSGIVTRILNNGTTEDLSIPSGGVVFGLWKSSTTLYAIVAQNDGTSLLYRHDGSDWQALSEFGALISIWGVADDNLYVGGTELWHFDGSDWTMEPRPREGSLVWSISGTGANDVFAVWNGATSDLMHFDGADWSPVKTPSDAQMRMVVATPEQVFVDAGGWALEVLLRD
jgi:hypothetical protein